MYLDFEEEYGAPRQTDNADGNKPKQPKRDRFDPFSAIFASRICPRIGATTFRYRGVGRRPLGIEIPLATREENTVAHTETH